MIDRSKSVLRSLLKTKWGVKYPSMMDRARGAALCLGLAALAGPVSAEPKASPRPTAQPPAIVARGSLPSQRATDLYSARARRLVRGYLRLRMLELREGELARVRAVIEGKLGVDSLLLPSPGQPSISPGLR
jgi:hypothetical protein